MFLINNHILPSVYETVLTVMTWSQCTLILFSVHSFIYFFTFLMIFFAKFNFFKKNLHNYFELPHYLRKYSAYEHPMCVWELWACLPQLLRWQLYGVISPHLPLHRFWGSNSHWQACTAFEYLVTSTKRIFISYKIIPNNRLLYRNF